MRMSSGPCAATSSASAMTCAGVAQVDADDAQAVRATRRCRPSRVKRRTASSREARRDRRVRAVAQQPQRDVHPDLRPPAGEQRAAAGQVGARVAALVVAAPRRRDRAGGRRRRRRGSAACRRSTRGRAASVPAARRRRARGQRQPLRLVVDPARARRSPSPRSPPSSFARTAARRSARRCSLTVLNSRADRAPDRDRVGMLGGELLDLGEDAQRVGEAVGIDAVHR